MEAFVQSSGPLRDELAPQLDERRDHIERKLDQLESVQGTLVTAAAGLPAMASALDEVVRLGRGGREWADPALNQAFTISGAALQYLAAGVLRPPVRTDDTPRGPEQFDRTVPDSYIERGEDSPPLEPSEWHTPGGDVDLSFDEEAYFGEK
jgi:hypothetical protein